MADAVVKPATDASDPTLRFTYTLRFQYRYQIPLGIAGQVRTKSGRIVGDLVDLAVQENAVSFGILPRSNQNEPVQERNYVLDCRLTEHGIAALEEERESDPRKDIHLILTMRGMFLQPTYRMIDRSPASTVEGMVAGDQTRWGPGIGFIESMMLSSNVTIYSSQWTSEFAPAFGIGQFLIVELPVISDHTGPASKLGERIREASIALESMRKDVEAGHWTECIEHSRPVTELLKDPEEVRVVLERDGLSTSAADDLLKSIRGAFDFASKFIKKVERGGAGLNPTLVAKKEDALYVYSSSVTLLNLIARKAARENA